MTNEELDLYFPDGKLPIKVKQSIKVLIDELDLIPIDCIPDYLVEDYSKKMRMMFKVNNIERKNAEEFFRRCSLKYKKRKKDISDAYERNLQLRLFDNDIIKLY